MENIFKEFNGCFKMSIHTNDSSSLQRLRVTNDGRKELDVKIARGTVTKLDVIHQLKTEIQIFEFLLKKIKKKIDEKKSYTVIDNVILILSKRINKMWNTMYLLFTINEEFETEFKKILKKCELFRNFEPGSYYVKTISTVEKLKIMKIEEDYVVFDFASSDFAKILQTTTFVDKTLMIKEVFRNKEFKGTAVLAPHKFGKSTNLTMLKYFLEIQVNSLGKPLTKAKSGKPITDTSNYQLFKGLKISKEANIMKKHFGKYPVLYANFKIEIDIKSYSSIVEGCKEVIHKSFKLHNYLQKSSKLNPEQKNLCKLWCGVTSHKNRSIDQILIGFKSLCTFLSKHYNKPCFVLIDELDFLTSTVTITENFLLDYKSIFLFLRRVLLFLKNDKLVVKSFVTGKSVNAIHGMVPYCIQILPFYKFHNFTDYYGLTMNELEYLFKKPEFQEIPATIIKQIKAYYGTYNKIDQFTKTNKQIYCIWSILNVLIQKKLDNYWRDFGNSFCYLAIPYIKETVLKLLDYPQVVTLYDTEGPRTYPIPPPIIESSEVLPKTSSDYFLNLLLDLGYMTCYSRTVQVLDFYEKSTSYIGYIKLPNEEVKHDIENKITLIS